MEHGSESPLVTAQRSAILQIRGRYERGELPFDAFRDALNALTEARSPEECAAILRDLPHSPLATLAALEPPRLTPSAPGVPAPVPTSAAPRRISAIISEARKTRNGWSLAPDTHVRALMGSVTLDLRRAQLPAEARLTVRATMGEVNIYIPEDVAVSVRSTVWMGEVRALGENISGVIASGEEEHIPTNTEPRARLIIEVSALMGEVNVALAGPNAMSITDLAYDTLRAALEGIRRGLEAGAGQGVAIPQASDNPQLPSAPAE